MISGILTSALDEVMEDSDIHTLLEDIPKEPLLYFAQISTSDSNNGIYLEDTEKKKQSVSTKKPSSHQAVSEKLIK
jgi:hypothetical protein